MSLNCYTDKQRDNLLEVAIGLSKVIQDPKQFSKESIETILTSSKDFLYIPKISSMTKEVENYYKQKYNSQLNLKFK